MKVLSTYYWVATSGPTGLKSAMFMGQRRLKSAGWFTYTHRGHIKNCAPELYMRQAALTSH